MNANGAVTAAFSQQCPVCKTRFDRGVNLPKALECIHSVCVVCAPGCIRGGRATCPVCQHETPVPRNGLLTDYYIMQADQQAPRRPSADMEQRRKALPIFKHREEITKTIMYESRVLILHGGTGSGKTTQLPQYILEEMDYFASQGDHISGIIGCTQPRKIAAISSARRVAQERNSRVGGEVGYHIRFVNCSSDRTKILFMTDGILKQELLADPLLKKYAFIIIDEAHVRSTNIDFLLTTLRETLKARESFKLIISSATMDADDFAYYFREKGPVVDIDAPVISVDGRNYPVEVLYDEDIIRDLERYHNRSKDRISKVLAQAAAWKVRGIVRGGTTGDILVFLPGQEDIERCCSDLREFANELHAPLDIYPLYSALPSHLQNDALQPTTAGRRKVVVATNIAETSLTIDGIVHVVDTGVWKEPLFDPATGFHRTEEVRISKNSAIQRAGRAGRTAPGICYRLYSQEEFEEMPESDTAEITRTDLTETLLMMCKLDIRDVMGFPFMQKPSERYYVKAVEDLVAMEAMDADTFRITLHGEKIMKLSLEPCLANAVLRSVKHGCSTDMIVIVALISIDPAKVFYKPQDKSLHKAAKEKRRALRIHAGDHVTLLNVYRKWTSDGSCGRQWCDDNFVHYQTMVNAKKLVTQLRAQLARLGERRRTCGEEYQRIQAALAESFADKAASHCGDKFYVWLADESQRFEWARLVIAEDSDLRNEQRPIVICHKVVVKGSKKSHQMHLVTEVQRETLPERVRAKALQKEPWGPGAELMKRCRAKNAAKSPANTRCELSLAQ